MRHFTALKVKRLIARIPVLEAEIAELEKEYAALPKIRWVARGINKERRRELRGGIRSMRREIYHAENS